MMKSLSGLRSRSGIRSGIHTSILTSPDAFLYFLPFFFISFTAKLKYTFFDTLGQNNRIPEPITPFPMLFAVPCYRPAGNTVEMTVSNFLCWNPKPGPPSLLEVRLGDILP